MSVRCCAAPRVSQNQVQKWSRKRTVARILDRKDGGTQPILISSHHVDELRSVERGYGVSAGKRVTYSKPEDYLDSFKAFLRTN